jgi:CDP-4-dehydro-6-deoxyglucose reductase, E1
MMRVPYAQSVHGQEEVNAVVAVLQGNTALGKCTDEFENKIAEMFGKRYGCMVNSGSSANLLAFELLDLQAGSEVITPILTFATVVAPILQKGLVPVFADVEPDTYQIDLDKVEPLITNKTRAIMAPSLLGNMVDLERLQMIARKYSLYVIEDSCDTLGAKFKGQPTGRFSDISVTSFYGSHIINGAGGGGMICVNDATWAQRLKVLRGWGRQSSLWGEKETSEQLENRFNIELEDRLRYDAKFVFSEIGYNFLPLEVQSAFALEQLKRFPQFVKRRKYNFEKLYSFFGQFPELFMLPRQTEHVDSAWLAFPVMIKESAHFDRQDMVTHLERSNIQTRPVFTGNILKQPGFRSINAKIAPQGYPNTERVMRNAFMLGLHQGLSDRQMKYQMEKVCEVMDRKGS